MIARVLAIATVLLVAGTASAGVTVTWSAPDECPERERVVERIDRELGGPAAQVEPAVEASLTVTHDDATWRLHVALRGPAASLGERELEGASCEEVTDAAVLIVALAVRAEAAHEATPAPASPAAPVVIENHVVVHASPPITWAVAAGVGGEAGALPGAGPGFEVALAMQRSRLSVELAGMYWLGQRATLASSDAGGDVDLLAGTLRGCYAVIATVGACAGVEVGALHAVGVNATDAMTHRTLWLAPAVGVVARWPLGNRMGVVAHGDLAAPVTRPHFVLDGNPDDIFQPAPVVGRVGLALEAQFR